VVPIIQGKVLGGGTSVNAMMYVRGDWSVVQEWYQRSGNHPNWSSQRFLEAFLALEHCHGDYADPEIRGTAGPIPLCQTPRPSLAAQAFLNAARERGFTAGDFNGERQLNTAGLMQLNIDLAGRRVSTARAFINSHNLPNLTVLCGTQSSHLVMEGDTAVGAQLSDGTIITADRVVVTAGALQTPSLLMRSGIGDPDRLQAAGILCRVPNSAVGANLSDHMRVMVAYQAEADPGVTEFLCEATLFTRSGLKPSPEADIQINISAGVEGFIPPEFLPDPHPQHTVIFVPILARPSSSGSILPMRSDSGTLSFAIDPAYLRDPVDLDTYCRAIGIVRELASTQSMGPFCQHELCPGPGLNDESYLRQYATTIWHPVGTCSMGEDAGNSACAPDFRLYGTTNVYVADASILPSLPSGNPQAAIFAAASIAAATLAAS
jgi:choline dehydrogenase